MIQHFQNLILIEQIILGVYIVLGIAALIGFTYDGAAHAGQLFKTVKSLLWPSWFFRMWGFIAREHESSVIVKAFLKGSITFAYMPTVAWVIAWVVSNFYPIPPQYLDFAVPMTFSKGLELSGYRVIEIDWLLKWIPTPFVYSESLITMQGLSLGWFMANMLRSNARADVLFKQRDFKGDFLRVLKAQNAFVEARENKMPRVRDTKRGEALVCTQGVSLTAQKIMELAPIIESNLGCWITGVEQNGTPDNLKIKYRYRSFPEMIKFDPVLHKHPNPRFIVIGTDTRELIGHAFTKDANALICGLMGKGKSTALRTMCVSIFNQNPNSILILIDPTKGAIDFGFLKFDPKERDEFLQGTREAHDVHSIPLVLTITDASKVERALSWCLQEKQRRNNLCADIRYCANGLKDLYENPDYRGEELPSIYIMTDENSLLNDALDDGSESAFKHIVKTGRAFDMNCIFATQETYQKDLRGKRNLVIAYSFHLAQAQLKLIGINLKVPNETGIFAYPTDAGDFGGASLAKGFFVKSKECAPFIAEQTKKANQTTHRLFRELVTHVNQAFRDDMMEKVERKLQTSAIGHREPVITGNYREAA